MKMIQLEKHLTTERDNVDVVKRELVDCVQKIFENDDDLALDEIHRAQHALCFLKDILLMRNLEAAQCLPGVPSDYLCPISGKIINEPVTLFTKQAFDKVAFQKWVDDAHRTCGQSELVTSFLRPAPDPLLRGSIAEWCKERLDSMLKRLSSSSLTDVKEAAKVIRQFTKYSKYTRALFGDNGSTAGFEILFKALSNEDLDKHPDLREDLVTIVFNLSLHGSRYKKLFSENPLATTLLARCLSYGTIQSRRNAAAAIWNIVEANDSKLQRYGAAGALKGLVGLLSERDGLAVRDAATAMWKLCFRCVPNRGWAIHDGAIRVIMKQLSHNILVSHLLALYVVLSTDTAVSGEKLGGLEAVRLLLKMLKNGEMSEVSKEHCAVVLLTLCKKVKGKAVKMIKVQEGLYNTISRLAATGTARAQEDALDILYLIRRSLSRLP